MPKWGIGEKNEENAEDKGGNARNEMKMWGISKGMQEIWVKMQKMQGIRVVMQGIKMET